VNQEKNNRLVFFAAAVGIHALLLFFLVFKMAVPAQVTDISAGVFKLQDLQEYIPAPPPPPPEIQPEPVAENTTSAFAETMVETDVLPDDLTVLDYVPVTPAVTTVQETYLSQGKISVIPVLPDDKIKQAMVYPRIALASGVTGTVYLELYIDRYGVIQRITVLKEEPEGRGFGDAAVKAFSGITAMSPAYANGVAVGVRYRYPVRFTIKD
jgi:protein TonB